MVTVYYGDCILYGVESVSLTMARPVSAYDGLGQGEFQVPGSRKLRQWTLKCHWSDYNDMAAEDWTKGSRLLEQLHEWMEEKKPRRLVISGERRRESASACLTQLEVQQNYEGIYQVTVRLTEYRRVEVQQSEIPPSTRPGMPPEDPGPWVLNTPMDAAAVLPDGEGEVWYWYSDEEERLVSTDNRLMIPNGVPVFRSTEEYGSYQRLAEAGRVMELQQYHGLYWDWMLEHPGDTTTFAQWKKEYTAR